MSFPPKYALWVQRRGDTAGRWHSCFTRGESLCLFDSETGPHDFLRGGYDNAMHYTARVYDPSFVRPTVGMAHYHGLPRDLERIRADVQQIDMRRAMTAFNPSVVSRDGFLYATVRVLERGPTRHVNRTRLGRLFPNGALEDVREIATRDGQRDFEDVRLVVRDGRFWGVAAVQTTDPRVAVLELTDNGEAVVHVQASPRVEKNWMPFVDEGKLKLVYSIDPAPTVLTFDDVIKQVSPSAAMTSEKVHVFRGGSQVIEWDGDYLCVIHHVNLVDGHPIYLHRFVRFDRTLTAVVVSKPFYLYSHGIEFVSGAVMHEGKLVLTFGLADQTPYVATVRRDEVARLLYAR